MDITGRWPEGQKQFKELIGRAKNQQTLAKIIPEIVNRLIEHYGKGELQDLTEAHELIDQLAQIEPDGLDPLVLEVKLNRVQNQIANATALIKQYTERPQLPVTTLAFLARMAEDLVQDDGSQSFTADAPAVQGALDLAEQIHRQAAASKVDGLRGTVGLVDFLGRRGRVKEALDVCEPLWQSAREPIQVVSLAAAMIRVVLNPKSTIEPAQMTRVVDWLTQALTKNPQSTVLLTMLGNLKESQGNYAEAEGLYHRESNRAMRTAFHVTTLPGCWLSRMVK